MRSLIAAALVVIVAAAARVSATVYVPADFDEIVTASVFIAHGRVVDVRAEATRDRGGIVTFVTLAVDESLKGGTHASITFRVPGGEIGRYRRVVVGAPRFDRGDEVVVFLAARGPSVPYVFGLSQGVYRVSRASGRAMVGPPPARLEGASGRRLVRGDPARRPLPLADFVGEVRAAIARAR